MKWVRRRPFKDHYEAVEHMVELLSAEADRSGQSFSDSEKKLLASGSSESGPVPDDLRQRTKILIGQLVNREAEAGEDDELAYPKSFSNSFQWASDRGYSNIVALTEEVAREETPNVPTKLRGWRWTKDRLQLVGCGCAVVLLMFAVVICMGFIFHWK